MDPPGMKPGGFVVAVSATAMLGCGHIEVNATGATLRSAVRDTIKGVINRKRTRRSQMTEAFLWDTALLSAAGAGCIAFRRAEDPNEVVILRNVADVAKARAWLGSDETKVAMGKSGVVGSPNVVSQPRGNPQQNRP
jgi:hypothetical protein